MRFLMCRPDYYGIKYEINPWMHITHTVDQKTALSQWEMLYQTIKKCGAKVDLVDPADGWPDMVFTANAGLYYRQKMILPHFKFKERQGELPYFKAWFEAAHFQIANEVTPTTPFFEGAGDALLAKDTLFAAYGFRSDRRFYEEADYLDHNNIIYCELTDPYFYHLDTCFCPINEKTAIWYPAAFTPDTQQRMANALELIPVQEDEARRFACNAVVIDQHIILPTGCPQISAELKKRGMTPHATPMDEYLKAGGACKCLTLRIDD